jgi:polysaccharide deacetylase 2 family uncharacterized protein YibQ
MKRGNKKNGGSRVRLRRVTLLLVVITGLLLALLFLLPESRAGGPVGSAPPEDGSTRKRAQPPGAAPERPLPARLAVVIDDVGYSLEDLKPFLEFPGPLTFAVLPRLPHSREAAEMIEDAGRELLLHCPMEPLNGEDSGPGTLLTGQPAETLRDELALNLDSVPRAVGMNNHMGSRLTADEQSMRAVMPLLKERNIFFLDSRTTADSVCRGLAEEYGVPFLERDIFIDNERSAEYIRSALNEGLKIASRRGYAVLIGHIYSEAIIDVLSEAVEEAENWELISLTRLLDAEKQEAERP